MLIGQCSEDNIMRISHRFSNMARQALTRILMAALIAIVCPGSSLASKEGSDAAGAMLLVLDNCDKKIWHYSGTGTNLATYTGVSANQKWLAVVHRSNADS